MDIHREIICIVLHHISFLAEYSVSVQDWPRTDDWYSWPISSFKWNVADSWQGHLGSVHGNKNKFSKFAQGYNSVLLSFAIKVILESFTAEQWTFHVDLQPGLIQILL